MTAKSSPAVIWSIAGSDCGGGAGIQADLRTVQSFHDASDANARLHLCTVITAVTAQNSLGVHAINALSAEAINSQLLALSEDLPPKVIKIGLLANIAQVELIASWLKALKRKFNPLVIYDPVAVASSGDTLTEQDILPTLITQLLPLVDVLTPNTPELQRLTGIYVLGLTSLRQAAQKLLDFGVRAAVLKGGHLNLPTGYCVDYCLTDGSPLLGITPYHQEIALASVSQTAPHNHGTGCSFASALAACLALGYPLEDAIYLAKSYINQGLRLSFRLGEGRGPVQHAGFPDSKLDAPMVLGPTHPLWLAIADEPVPATPPQTFAKLAQPLGLYVIVDNCQLLEQALQLGVKTAQLRCKMSPHPSADEQLQLQQQIAQAVALGKAYHAQVFINDHWQLAIASGAYGVHLGQEDIDRADLTAIADAGLRLGLSSHGFYKLQRAAQWQPSYLAIGAIFDTSTKDMSGKIQGLSKLRRLAASFAHLPLVAIGGINNSNIASVLACGVNHVAVVSAFSEAEDKASAVALLQAQLKTQHWAKTQRDIGC